MDNIASLSANNGVLSNHYDQLVSKFGSNPQASQWRDQQTQIRRFEILCKNVPRSLSESSILDFGCGTGAFCEYLKSSHSFTGRYTGIDISPKAIEIAKSIYTNGNFLNLDILLNELPETYDYIFVSGTFNNEMKNHLEWVYANLRKLFQKTNIALVFNMLSNYVDYKDEGLYYSDPEEIFSFCKSELSPAVNLFHSEAIYESLPPFEYVIQVYRTQDATRSKLK
jgi:SAM-dependent methyltransferase